MKRFLLILTIIFCCMPVAAQREQDFTTRYMALYGKDYELTNKTISPKMMERIMQLKSVEENKSIRKVLSQIKSFSILSDNSESNAPELYQKACRLARQNAKRYAPYSEQDNQNIYVRKRGKLIVEMVVVSLKENNAFSLINITGNLSDDFIKQVIAL